MHTYLEASSSSLYCSSSGAFFSSRQASCWLRLSNRPCHHHRYFQIGLHRRTSFRFQSQDSLVTGISNPIPMRGSNYAVFGLAQHKWFWLLDGSFPTCLAHSSRCTTEWSSFQSSETPLVISSDASSPLQQRNQRQEPDHNEACGQR